MITHRQLITLFCLLLCGTIGLTLHSGHHSAQGQQSDTSPETIFTLTAEEDQLLLTQADDARDGAGALNGEIAPNLRPFFFRKIPVNLASCELLTTIPGIGPVTAEHIHDFVASRNGLQSLDELLEINGIGSRKLKQFEHYLTL